MNMKKLATLVSAVALSRHRERECNGEGHHCAGDLYPQ